MGTAYGPNIPNRMHRMNRTGTASILSILFIPVAVPSAVRPVSPEHLVWA